MHFTETAVVWNFDDEHKLLLWKKLVTFCTLLTSYICRCQRLCLTIQFRSATGTGKGEGRSTLLFFENWKNMHRIWQKLPWFCWSLGLNFTFKNAILRESRRKISAEIFFCGAFVSCVVDKMFIEVPLSNKTSPAMKNSWLCPLTVKFLAYLWVLKNNW